MKITLLASLVTTALIGVGGCAAPVDGETEAAETAEAAIGGMVVPEGDFTVSGQAYALQGQPAFQHWEPIPRAFGSRRVRFGARAADGSTPAWFNHRGLSPTENLTMVRLTGHSTLRGEKTWFQDGGDKSYSLLVEPAGEGSWTITIKTRGAWPTHAGPAGGFTGGTSTSTMFVGTLRVTR